MADLTRVQAQVTILLNANTRDASGNPVYSSTVGDKARHATEIQNSCYNAALEVANAICETASHPFRSEFIEVMDLNHGEPIPFHYGDFSPPEIVPFANAGYCMRGIKSTPDRIDSYRRNRHNVYSPVAHDASDGGQASPITGYYDVVNSIFYFTGYQATAMLCLVERTTVFTKLPDSTEPTIIKLACALSSKEGDTSDGLFQSWAALGMQDLQMIRSGGTEFPPVDMAQQARATV